MNRRFVFAASAALVFSSFAVVSPTARAQDAAVAAPAPSASAPEAIPVSVVRAQFAVRVESGKPIGDASELRAGQMVTYWVEVNSPKAATTVTLVWKADGVEAARQSLDVGRAPAWRTWGQFPIRKAKVVEVQVLDATGAELRTDSMTVLTGESGGTDGGVAVR